MARLPRAIQDLDDFTESKNVLLYGDTGVGKTAQLATLNGKVLILATESGTVTIKRFLRRYKLAGGQIKVWPVNQWSDLVEAYMYLQDNCKAWDWIAVDSLTNMQQLALRSILENAVKNNPERDPDIPAIQDHQKWQNMFKRFVTDFNQLPVNVLWTATAMRREDQEGEDLTLPAIQGKDYEISAWVCAQMHVVTYYGKRTRGKGDKRTLIRRLLFEGVPPYFAKDRYGVFPRVVTISEGEKQIATLGNLLQRIDVDPDAVDKARDAMERAEEDHTADEDDVEDDEDLEPDDVDEDVEDDDEADDDDDEDDDDDLDPALLSGEEPKKPIKRPAKKTPAKTTAKKTTARR